MDAHEIIGLLQTVAVIALVVVAAVLATPKNKVPLALRGILRIVRKDSGAKGPESRRPADPVPAWKRLLAFALVVIAFVLATVIL